MKTFVNGAHIVLFFGLFLFFVMVYVAYYVNEYQKTMMGKLSIPSSESPKENANVIMTLDVEHTDIDKFFQYSMSTEISTFYYPRPSFMLEDITMLKLWARNMYSMGYYPRILSLSEIPNQAILEEYKTKISKYPSLDDVQTRDSKFFRWLAFAFNDAGITCDYRSLYSKSSPTVENLLNHTEKSTSSQLTIFDGFGVDIAVGTKNAYEDFVKDILNYQVDLTVDNSNGKAHCSVINIARKAKFANIKLVNRKLPIHIYNEDDQAAYEKSAQDFPLLAHDRAQLESVARFVQRVEGKIRFVNDSLGDKAVEEMFKSFNCEKLDLAWQKMTEANKHEFRCDISFGEFDENFFNIWIMNSDETQRELPEAIMNSGKIFIGFRDAIIPSRLLFEYQFGLLLPQFTLLHDQSLLELHSQSVDSVKTVIDLMVSRMPVISSIEKRIDEVNVFK